ncbi:MAG: epoxyqueuosine reductase QueH [Desulfatitalea sp.]|nr:epoxyqueuosine reductase QueH [Desulfatitalea sp.]NNK02424.1 epoxyqueuosine reductase QueH [Desulfatitalea sp.]
MKLLLHTCCGPCTIYPLRVLREAGSTVHGFFYRSNIHPFSECVKRQQTLETYAAQADLKLIIEARYDLHGFLRNAAFRETDRCRLCYYSRLRATARIARRGTFQAFSSTLLYSRYQQHDMIRSIGEAVGREVGVPFYYQDFRTGWNDGVNASKSLGMYRQKYCGCIYSELERYDKSRSQRTIPKA